MNPVDDRCEPLAGDASARRYQRLWRHDGSHVIRVDYPPDDPARLARDLQVAAWLSERGLRLPRVQDVDLEQGWAVLEDFGPDDAEETLWRLTAEERCGRVFDLVEPLVRFARLNPVDLPSWNAPLDSGRLRWELAGWELWWAVDRLGRKPSAATDAWLDDLAGRVGAHPRRVCHRDYHLNNLYFLSGREVGVIDAQDVLVGPDSYDIASLLGERALPDLLGSEQVARCVIEWVHRTAAAPGWEQRFAETRLQRGLKVLGTFARLVAAGRPGYERWLPRLAVAVGRLATDDGAPPDAVALLLD